MSKLYVQGGEPIFRTTASLAISASISGSCICEGYARLVGLFCSDASAAIGAASGLEIRQSCDYGAHWDSITASYALAACVSGSINAPLVGNAVRVTWWNGATAAASQPRIAFYAFPV
jgi:hypothetical protein